MKAQYAVNPVVYAPESFAGGMQVDTVDDVWSDSISLPFPFCFFGNTYNKLWIGTNGVVTFNYPGPANIVGSCIWDLSPGTPFPNSGPWPTNSIMAPYTDINPQLNGQIAGSINWKVVGTAPYRKAVLSYNSIPFYSCTNILMNSQIILYETTNIIDIYIANKQSCPSWNGGFAVEGIENDGGSLGFILPGRNNGQTWTAANDGQRFTPVSNVCSTFSAGPDMTICQHSSINPAGSSTGMWSAAIGNPSPVLIVSPLHSSPLITGFDSVGVYIFIYTGSSQADTMTVTVLPKPDGGPDMIVCPSAGQATLSAVTAGGVWIPINYNNSIIDSPSSLTATVSQLGQLGVYTFLWSVNGCSDSVSVIIESAGGDQYICINNTARLQAEGNGTWSQIAGQPAVIHISDSAQARAQVSGFSQAGTFGFIWTGLCIDTSYINVSLPSNAGADQTICLYSATNLQGAGLGSWSPLLSNPVITNFSDPYDSSSLVNGFNIIGLYGFTWLGIAGCMDTAFITVVNCSDSVWPGDADANHIVDAADLLPIGLAYGASGITRQMGGTVWQADYAADWADIFQNGTNYKHADCNGDGTIDYSDTLAINQNFGLTHTKTGHSAPWRSGIPALAVRAALDTIFNNTLLTITFSLGDTMVPLQNFYGIAFTYNFDPLVVDSNYTDIDFGNTWLGNNSSKMSIRKIFNSTGEIKAAVCGYDHSNRNGYGPIGSATFRISTSYLHLIGATQYLNIGYISDVKAVDSYGNEIQINEGADTTVITRLSEGIQETDKEYIRIQPNPARAKVLMVADHAIGDVIIYDIADHELFHISGGGTKELEINTSSFAEGLYFVHITTTNGSGTLKLSILK